MASAAEVEISRPATTFAAEQPPSPPQFRIDQGRVAASQLGWLRSTPANATIDEIRQRLQDDGYVWVKSVLPREDVLGMREHFFSQFAGRGLLKPGTAAVDGIYNAADDVSLHWGVGDGNPQGDEELRRLTDVHTTAQYLQFVNHSALRKTVHDITGWDEEVMLHRTLLRHCVPGGSSTGIHYDKLFLRGGGAFFLTALVPIGDVSSIGGRLHYLSDRVGLGQALEDDYDEARADKISAFNRNIGVYAGAPACRGDERHGDKRVQVADCELRGRRCRVPPLVRSMGVVGMMTLRAGSG